MSNAILAHLVWLYSMDRRYAKWAAKNYEQIDPDGCAGMFEKLREAVTEQKEKQDGPI